MREVSRLRIPPRARQIGLSTASLPICLVSRWNHGRGSCHPVAQSHIDGAGRRCQDDTVVVVGEASNLVSPTVDGFFETANNRKTQRGDAGWQPVDEPPGFRRRSLHRLTDRLMRNRTLIAPVARRELAAAIQNGARRPQANRGKDGIPGQYTKNMPVRLQHRIPDDAANQFAARLIAQLHLTPAGQQFPRTILIPGFKRVTDVREMMAELTKAQGDVQQRRAPERGKWPAGKLDQHEMDSKGSQGGHAHGQAPDHPTVVRAPGVEAPAAPAHPASHRRMDQITPRQRSNLLKQQGKQNREKTHVGIIPRGVPRSTPVRGDIQADRNR